MTPQHRFKIVQDLKQSQNKRQYKSKRRGLNTPAVKRFALLKPSVCDAGPPVLQCRPAGPEE